MGQLARYFRSGQSARSIQYLCFQLALLIRLILWVRLALLALLILSVLQQVQ